MAKRRITRKAMKQKDEFQTKAEKATEWILEQGWKKVSMVLVGAAALLMLVVVASHMMDSRSEEASYEYSKAYRLYSETRGASGSEFIPNKDKLEEAVKAFDEVIKDYGSTFYGEMAQYFKAQSLFELGREDEGMKLAEKLFAEADEDIVKNKAGFFLAQKYIAEDNFEKARVIYDELKSDMNSMMNPNEIYYKSAELYEKEGETEKASEDYLNVISNEEFTVYQREARLRLNILNPKALEEFLERQQ